MGQHPPMTLLPVTKFITTPFIPGARPEISFKIEYHWTMDHCSISSLLIHSWSSLSQKASTIVVHWLRFHWVRWLLRLGREGLEGSLNSWDCNYDEVMRERKREITFVNGIAFQENQYAGRAQHGYVKYHMLTLSLHGSFWENVRSIGKI